LAVAVLFELCLCAGYFHERWHKSLVPLGRPQALTGAGLVIRSDGLGYYAWLRSLLLDGDWSFDNEFDEHNVIGDFVPPPDERTPLGRRPNPWSVGPACVWALTVVPGHGLLRAWPGPLPWPADGYALPYQLIVGGTTLLASFLGLGFLYGLCRHDAGPAAAALAATLLTLGTSLVYYNAVEPSMGHGVGTAAVAGLAWYWRRTYGSARPGRWLLLGVLVGFVAAVRWQLATLAVLPVGEALLGLPFRDRRAHSGAFGLPLNGALAVAGAVLGFSPQLLAWRCVYGDWFVAPMAVAHNWLRPAVGHVLFSADRGLFVWTPLALVALLGGLTGLRRADPAARLLLFAFAVQVYALASVFGTGVYLGVAFGFRQLTESLVLLAPGLAVLLQRAPRWVGVAGCLLVLWNLLLLAQFRYGLIPADAGADLLTLLANVGHLLRRRPLSLLGQAVAAPALLLWWQAAASAGGRGRGQGRSTPEEALQALPPGQGARTGYV
jgi:hypothetical protein